MNGKNKEYSELLINYHLGGSAYMFLEYANNPSQLSIDEVSRFFAEMHYNGIFSMIDKLRISK